MWPHCHLFISVKIVYIGKKINPLLIGKKGQYLWSLFLPLSALCALSTPLSFSERNGPTIDLFTDSDAILKMLSVDFCGKVKVNSDSSSKIV